MLKRLGAALWLLLTMACGSAPAGEEPGPAREEANGLVFEAEQSRYTEGDTIRVRLINHSDAEVGHNLCFAFLMLERWTGAEWVPLPTSLDPAPDVTCGSIQYLLRPGGEATGVAYLPRRIAGGTYRISVKAEVAGQNCRIATGPFLIQRSGAWWFLPSR